MGGLVQTGRGNLTDAMGGFANTAAMRQKRDAANAQIRQAEQSQKIQSTSGGAMTGATIGSAFGPIGMVAGGLIGGALGYLTAEIF